MTTSYLRDAPLVLSTRSSVVRKKDASTPDPVSVGCSYWLIAPQSFHLQDQENYRNHDGLGSVAFGQRADTVRPQATDSKHPEPRIRSATSPRRRCAPNFYFVPFACGQLVI
jgi:hypothetical protein